jgi:hypothetical protein
LDDSDTRTPAQRRADALVEICRRQLDGTAGAPPSEASRPGVPHLSLVVGLDALRGDGPGECRHESGEPIPIETARRYACDATACRLLMAASEVLDLGRTSRVVSAAQRRAVILRDRHCAWPGCDRPPTWCDIHHIRHWAKGGPTDLWNLVLLCRKHHTATHEDGYGLDHDGEGGLVFTRPDGSIIEHRRAPPKAG